MKFKFNWGHGIFIFFSIFALFMTGMAILSSNQKFDLVSEDYYTKELAFQTTINDAHNTTLYHEHPSVSVTQNGDVSIALSTANTLLAPVTINAVFYKPDEKNDDFSAAVKVAAEPGVVSMSNHAHGHWKVFLRWNDNGHAFAWSGEIDR